MKYKTTMMSISFFYSLAITGTLLTSSSVNDTLNVNFLKMQALKELKTVLKTQPEWIKVHAAEYLIWLGHKKDAKDVFLKENKLHGTEPRYRIGIWRVLAQTESDATAKMKWVNKIMQVFGDLQAPDRLHAAETLGKLNTSPFDEFPEATRQSLSAANRNLGLYTLWATSYQSPETVKENRHKFLQTALNDTNKDARLISSYILRKLKGLNKDEWTELATKAIEEPDTSAVKMSLLTTAFIIVPDKRQEEELFVKIRNELVKDPALLPASKRIELAMALAENGSKKDLALLNAMLENNNTSGIYDAHSKEAADVRAAAAYAILKLTK